jgi:hypothetical protein
MDETRLKSDSASAAMGLEPENVMACFRETSWENWSFGGGRLIHT